jgi:hypothetical protein
MSETKHQRLLVPIKEECEGGREGDLQRALAT